MHECLDLISVYINLFFAFILQFLQQYNHFESLLQLFRLQPSQFNKNLDELIMFLAQVTLTYGGNFEQRCITFTVYTLQKI